MIGLLLATHLATGTLGSPDGALAPIEPPTVLELREPRWIRHRVGNGERLVDIAGRYGVTVDDLRTWNHMEGRRRRLAFGRKLRVKANRLPPPRIKKTHVVERGETWSDIGIRYGVDSVMLRALNWKHQKSQPRAGVEIKIWIDPGRPRTVGARTGPPVPSRFTLPRDAKSMGRPQMGRLLNSIQLPESNLYTRIHPQWLYGSSHTLLNLQLAIANFRHDTGFDGELVIGSISRWGGGKFYPHHSHQSGRDVDIRMPLRPGVGRKGNPWPEEIDWNATWGLVKALVDTGEVKFIFLERKLQRRLYEAGRQAGASHDELSTLIREYDRRRYSHAIVRHEKGHDGHIHVRFRCGPREDNCRG